MRRALLTAVHTGAPSASRVCIQEAPLRANTGTAAAAAATDAAQSSTPAAAEAAPATPSQPAAAPAATTTSVYITGLPTDCSEEEVAEEFSRVCGIIREDDGGRAKVKLYRCGPCNVAPVAPAHLVWPQPQ